MPPLNPSRTPPGRSASRLFRSLVQAVTKLRSPWTVVAIISAVILLGGIVFLTTSMSCAVTDYSSRTTSEGHVTFYVTVKNYGIEDQTIMVRTIADLHNETYEKRFQSNTVLQLRSGEVRTISVTIDTGLQPPVPEVYRAYAFVLPSH